MRRLDSRRRVLAGGQQREAVFYSSEFGRRMPSGVFPTCYYSHSSGALGEYVMLLEDCSGDSKTPLNFVFGNQIWGVPKPIVPARDEVDVLKAVFVRAATLHRQFWRDPRLLASVRICFVFSVMSIAGRASSSHRLAVSFSTQLNVPLVLNRAIRRI